MRAQTVIQMSVQRMSCTACGAEANASCNCGVTYAPIKERKELAAKTLVGDPSLSDREIARLTGLDKNTVAAVREDMEAGGEIHHLTERKGGDGKVYSLPVTRKEPDADKIERENQRNILLMNAAASVEAAVYHGPVDEKIIDACRRTAEAWSNLAESLEGIIR